MRRSRGSIKLMDLFGFRIGVDASWFLILFLMIFWLSGDFRSELGSSDGVAYLTAVATALMLFASLIVHELGHAFTARREGIEVRRIDLLLFGGLTEMSRDAQTPGEDFRIAAAGPLATLGFVLLCLVVDLIVAGPHKMLHALELDPDVRLSPGLLIVIWLAVWNIVLLGFNLIPAFPLDGGRIARSIVWRLTGSKQRGTRLSAQLGQIFAVALGLLGIALATRDGAFTGLWLLALSYMLFQSARAALVQSTFAMRLEQLRVADVMDAHPVAIPASLGLAEAEDEFFLRYGWPWFPVVDATGRLLGVVRQEVLQAQLASAPSLHVDAALERERVNAWQVGDQAPLTAALGSEGLGTIGAVLVVDGEGVLRGVLTAGRVRRALQGAVAAQ